MISNAILNLENNDKYCFLWSISASLHPRDNSNPSRVKIHRQHFIELDIDGFDFKNGFRCSDVHKFEKIKKLSIDFIESNFYQDQNNWKQNLIPIEISKND